MRRSDSTKPYGMFHPSGPYLRRSCSHACRKQRPKSILRHTSCFSHLLKNSGSEIGSERYEPRMLARRPFGGSLVILTPFCRMETGKCGDGADVSHSRKSGDACVV